MTPSLQRQQETAPQQVLIANSHHPEKYLPATLLIPQQDCPAVRVYSSVSIPQKGITENFEYLIIPYAVHTLLYLTNW